MCSESIFTHNFGVLRLLSIHLSTLSTYRGPNRVSIGMAIILLEHSFGNDLYRKSIEARGI